MRENRSRRSSFQGFGQRGLVVTQGSISAIDRKGVRKKCCGEIGDAVAFEVEHKIPFEMRLPDKAKRMRSSNNTYKD